MMKAFMKYLLISGFLLTSPYLLAQPLQEDAEKAYHQFDFWLGHWEVYKYGTDTLVGQSHIESILDGLGLLENYSAVNSSYQGKSLNKYNPAMDRWEQYWIDNSGLTLFLSGGLSEGSMILEDVEHGDPERGFNRIVWSLDKDSTVRQTWSVSRDGGKSWSVIFDGEYQPKK